MLVSYDSEHKPIISLSSSNWLVFVMEMLCVFCNIDTDVFNINYMNFELQRVKASVYLNSERVESNSMLMHWAAS
jgi:hypothetical protein